MLFRSADLAVLEKRLEERCAAQLEAYAETISKQLQDIRQCSGCTSPSPPPPSPPPPPPPKPPCAHPIDFILVLDESGSMKKPLPDGSMEGPSGMKAFAKQLVNQYALGTDAARFSLVSFATDATTRVAWSTNDVVINAGIDQMVADGRTSISDGFEAAGQLLAGGREGATKVVLLLSDGEQTVDAAPGKTPEQTAIDAATLVKGSGATVFAWGFGKASLPTLKQIATDPSKALLVRGIDELVDRIAGLEATVCNESPKPPSPPPPPPSPSPPSPSPSRSEEHTSELQSPI